MKKIFLNVAFTAFAVTSLNLETVHATSASDVDVGKILMAQDAAMKNLVNQQNQQRLEAPSYNTDFGKDRAEVRALAAQHDKEIDALIEAHAQAKKDRQEGKK